MVLQLGGKLISGSLHLWYEALHFLGGYLDDPDSDAVFYFLLKAVDRFYTQYHRYPGKF